MKADMSTCARARGVTYRGKTRSASFVFACRGGWARTGVGSSGAVMSCLGGDGGRAPPKTSLSLSPHTSLDRNCFRREERLHPLLSPHAFTHMGEEKTPLPLFLLSCSRVSFSLSLFSLPFQVFSFSLSSPLQHPSCASYSLARHREERRDRERVFPLLFFSLSSSSSSPFSFSQTLYLPLAHTHTCA